MKEAAAAALLTGLMILLFLGSWRSTLIVCMSIPLSILTSLAVMSLLGETINIMTLGGLALAVGILVDDATVEIENIHRNLGMQKGVVQAILDGAQQIAVPAFVSTLCICIVFVPVIFLDGVAKYLFTPLALAVVLAMMASYLLSRTLIPTMVRYLIPAELRFYRHGAEHEDEIADAGLIWNIHHRLSTICSSACAMAIRACCIPRWRIESWCWCCFSSSRSAAWGSIRLSAQIFSRRSTRGRFVCTCAAPEARASRKPSRNFRRSKIPSAKLFPRRNRRHSR